MVAMVSLTSPPPGETFVLVPGTKDLSTRRGVGSGWILRVQSTGLCCMQPAVILSLLSRVDLCPGKLVSTGAKESGEMMPWVRSTLGGRHQLSRSICEDLLHADAKCYAGALVKSPRQPGNGRRGPSRRWMKQPQFRAHISQSLLCAWHSGIQM